MTPAERIRRCLGRWEPSMVPTTANEGYARLVREEWEDALAALAELERERDELRAGLERLTRLYEDEHDLCERPMWLQELIARPAQKEST